jgi:hypothetical protein
MPLVLNDLERFDLLCQKMVEEELYNHPSTSAVSNISTVLPYESKIETGHPEPSATLVQTIPKLETRTG